MPSYKLTYFPARARAELTRQLFAQASVKYEDERIEFKDWDARKSTTPFGVLPVLEVDGKVKIPESLAIARYVARETGQYGKDSLEAAFIDAVSDTLANLFQSMTKMKFAKDPEKEAATQTFGETLQKTTKNLETLLTKNNGGNGFFVGDKPSMADLHLHSLFEIILQKEDKALDDTPKLKALYERVRALPKIKAWIASRPKSEF